MKEIDGKAKSVRDLLKGKRYTVDYYQRDYRWERKQVQELIDDLLEQFLESYEPTHERQAVQKYGHYFLGSVIFSVRDGDTFIVDGQQRLTTLTLLLLHLHLRQGNREDRVNLEELIFSERFGVRSFNIAVPERENVMRALFKGEVPDPNDASESVQTMIERYQDLPELLPQELDEKALPYFCDWLIDNVHLVEIRATTDEDAYTIFETMNDRGLSLTPLDMLKGYLLANITDSHQRSEAAKIWRTRMDALRKLGKDEDADAVKAWLRAKYAQNVRERHKGSENKDFERIGTEFHRWIKDHEKDLGLTSGAAYFEFVHQEMPFYMRHYLRLREASLKPVHGLEPVYHVACWRFTLQYPLLLAALKPTDQEEVINQKFRIVATFLDILLARRAVNYLSLNFAALSYTIFLIIKEIRGLAPKALIKVLKKKLDEQGCTFDGTSDKKRNGFHSFSLNHWSKGYIKTILARMTVHIEQGSELDTSLPRFFGQGKNRFEIEHIWSDHFEEHQDEFDSPQAFAEARNMIGGLLLLPKKFNASFGDATYEEKLPHYFGQNLLAKSLNPDAYKKNPGFKQFISNQDFPFKPHLHFKVKDLKIRQGLYRQLAEAIWNPDRLSKELEG